jgi:hypothetical protein
MMCYFTVVIQSERPPLERVFRFKGGGCPSLQLRAKIEEEFFPKIVLRLISI